jgi:hypothetical protein
MKRQKLELSLTSLESVELAPQKNWRSDFGLKYAF